MQGSDEEYYFKFQSDSINTEESCLPTVVLPSLNSNLILLIHKCCDSESGGRINFKFQSDSINTEFDKCKGENSLRL